MYGAFTNQYPLSKTLCFELKPVGETWDNLESKDYLQKDRVRADQYSLAKEALDEYHRMFIDASLSNASFDWEPLYRAIVARKNNPSDNKNKDVLESEQTRMIKAISKFFTSLPKYKGLFAKPAIDSATSLMEESGEVTRAEALHTFDSFSVYFTGYHENRRNIYSDKPKVSIAYRLVIDNFVKFVNNCLIFDMLVKNHPDIIAHASESLKVGDVAAFFNPSNYNLFLTQKGIEDYNYILGGKTKEDGSLVQGLNNLLNLEHQKDPDGMSKIQMYPLYKQILARRDSKSYLPKQFENSSEMIGAVLEFIEQMQQSGSMPIAQSIMSEMESYDLKSIFVEKTSIPNLSMCLFDSWDILADKLRYYFETNGLVSKKKDALKEISAFPMETIIAACDATGGFPADRIASAVNELSKGISESYADSRVFKSWDLDSISDSEYEDAVSKIRVCLEKYVSLVRLLKVFSADDSLPKDRAFYSELDGAIGTLSDIFPLFNKVRSFCTRKRYSADKIKVNLHFPTLADGWDQNKEDDNHAIILRKDGRFYLGVMDGCKASSLPEAPPGESFFEKMDYKLLPDPSKMLPKIFVKAKSSRELYGLTDHLEEGYANELHKKGPTFNLEFCHELINYYKDCISRYRDWDVFGFEFSDTESYQDLSDFYREITEKGYKVSFRNVPSSVIYDLVRKGKLFLFQIYNRDFAEHAHGRKNIHTMYWEALFSPENLASPRLKLNGQAELFFRKRSLQNDHPEHPRGSILVNRVAVDGSTVPTSVYRELKDHYNRGAPLSDEAESWKTRVKARESPYDIVKDRRFTVDKMMFHVPLTINFRANGVSGLNSRLMSAILQNPNVRIIGIDRGERNLIYISIIDRGGHIIEQKSLNILGGHDYKGALVERERGNKESRRNWTKAEGIRQLKEGYLSKVVSELAAYVIKENAILVMEDLNYGFKRGRFKIERQVYQKFENMLISKLNYVVFKDNADTEPGGVLAGYQITPPVDNVAASARQRGAIFYVPAAYTSRIDPTTGFTNLFSFGSVPNTVEGRRTFLSKMKSIGYDSSECRFVFTFDYRDFGITADYRNIWSVYSIGERYTFNRRTKSYERRSPNAMLRNALEGSGIPIGRELKEDILSAGGKVSDEVFYAFKLIMEMRVENDEIDCIQSPVKNTDGFFFHTGESSELPLDSDANGAYHIALKGELMLRMAAEGFDPEAKTLRIPAMTMDNWLCFMQTGLRSWRK